jgi:hypothetical protein
MTAATTRASARPGSGTSNGAHRRSHGPQRRGASRCSRTESRSEPESASRRGTRLILLPESPCPVELRIERLGLARLSSSAVERVIPCSQLAPVALAPLVRGDGRCTAAGRPAPRRRHSSYLPVTDDPQALATLGAGGGMAPSRPTPPARESGDFQRFQMSARPKRTLLSFRILRNIPSRPGPS